MNQLFTNYDVSKIFVWNNRYKKFTYTNSTGDTVTLVPGQVMGQVAATGKVLPTLVAAVDGSAIPVGLVANEREVEVGETVEISLCVGGDVVADKVVYNGANTAASIYELQRLDSRIKSDAGINLIASTELTGTDNE